MATPHMLHLTGRYQLGVLAILVPFALWQAPRFGLGVLLGGLLMALNFLLLRHLAARTFAGDRRRLLYAVALAVKLVAVMAVMAFVVLVVRVEPAGLATGLATLFLGLGAAMLHRSFRHRALEAPRAR